MRRRYVTADVFTDEAFGGNPLAVVLDAQGLSGAAMLAIAREFNYSETTFVLPPSNPAHAAQVRIFTPAGEVPFAGHPNVGTAVVLASRLPGTVERLVFEEQAGLVPLDIAREDGRAVGAELAAPQPFARGGDLAVADVAAAAGVEAGAIVIATHAPCAGSVGLPFVFAELASRAALAAAMPDPARLAGLLAGSPIDSVFLYTRDAAELDVQARMFFLYQGLREDPATGSANAALAGLLAACMPDGDAELALRVGQGFDMGRPSRLTARARKRGGQVVSTHVGGRCVEMMEGTLLA